jgi:hypothetical protein
MTEPAGLGGSFFDAAKRPSVDVGCDNAASKNNN